MLYVIGVLIFLVGCGFGVTCYIKKCSSKEDLEIKKKKAELESLTRLIASNAQRMKLGTEEDIRKIINIVLDTLDSISDLPDTATTKDKISKATIMAIHMCKVENIEIDRAKAFFISRLITIAYNEKHDKKAKHEN